MTRNPWKVFFGIIILTVFVAVFDVPKGYRLAFQAGPLKVDKTLYPPVIDIGLFGKRIYREFNTQFGLDLAGGTQLVLDADMSGIPAEDRQDALESSKQVIERRVNFFGVSEPVVQSARSQNTYRVIVELPGITEVDKAIATIGQTAKLEFREFIEDQESEKEATESGYVIPTLLNTKSVSITGRDLKSAKLSFSTETGEPEVALEFTGDGTVKFSEVTTRLVGKQLAVFLDDFPLTWPKVNTAITDGRAVITGGFTRDSARSLALQLNAGALPVPVKVVEKRIIGANLGTQSVAKSIQAGFIGLAIVAIYMIAVYGWLGIFAVMALIVYGLVTFFIFRLIPITLTLPGIAGFILSIGMAVDANILIFERFKEELRLGKPWKIAMELGFGRAWDSIRDANITTLITCLILFNPGNWLFLPSSGLVRGFAVTLFIGVIIGLFTGIIVTRTFIRVLFRPRHT